VHNARDRLPVPVCRVILCTMLRTDCQFLSAVCYCALCCGQTASSCQLCATVHNARDRLPVPVCRVLLCTMLGTDCQFLSAVCYCALCCGQTASSCQLCATVHDARDRLPVLPAVCYCAQPSFCVLSAIVQDVRDNQVPVCCCAERGGGLPARLAFVSAARRRCLPVFLS
jgi:hypothetical protein